MRGAIRSAAPPEARKRTVEPNRWRLRFIPIAIGALAMVLGLWTGLARLGVTLPGGLPPIADLHGALMICGFLGTLISLERAVALARPWSYAAPALSSLGALALIAGLPRVGALAFIAAGAVLLLASAVVAVRQLALFTVVPAIGAACWSAGTLQWVTGASTPAVAGWWLDFLLLTIAAERLELSRMTSPPRSSQVTFAASILLLLVGSARAELAEAWAPFTAAGLLGCAVWLLHHDVARRTVRLARQPRFAAVSILAGHLWLAVAGLWLLIAPAGSLAFSYDAVVHAIAIGFVLSMMFGHAPIILPAVTGLRVRYTGYAYAPLALLHASVALRLAGDALERVDLRAASGIVTAIALAGYALTLALASRSKFRTRGPSPTHH
jgi:hypothetical protein